MFLIILPLILIIAENNFELVGYLITIAFWLLISSLSFKYDFSLFRSVLRSYYFILYFFLIFIPIEKGVLHFFSWAALSYVVFIQTIKATQNNNKNYNLPKKYINYNFIIISAIQYLIGLTAPQNLLGDFFKWYMVCSFQINLLGRMILSKLSGSKMIDFDEELIPEHLKPGYLMAKLNQLLEKKFTKWVDFLKTEPQIMKIKKRDYLFIKYFYFYAVNYLFIGFPPIIKFVLAVRLVLTNQENVTIVLMLLSHPGFSMHLMISSLLILTNNLNILYIAVDSYIGITFCFFSFVLLAMAEVLAPEELDLKLKVSSMLEKHYAGERKFFLDTASFLKNTLSPLGNCNKEAFIPVQMRDNYRLNIHTSFYDGPPHIKKYKVKLNNTNTGWFQIEDEISIHTLVNDINYEGLKQYKKSSIYMPINCHKNSLGEQVCINGHMYPTSKLFSITPDKGFLVLEKINNCHAGLITNGYYPIYLLLKPYVALKGDSDIKHLLKSRCRFPQIGMSSLELNSLRVACIYFLEGKVVNLNSSRKLISKYMDLLSISGKTDELWAKLKSKKGGGKKMNEIVVEKVVEKVKPEVVEVVPKTKAAEDKAMRAEKVKLTQVKHILNLKYPYKVAVKKLEFPPIDCLDKNAISITNIEIANKKYNKSLNLEEIVDNCSYVETKTRVDFNFEEEESKIIKAEYNKIMREIKTDNLDKFYKKNKSEYKFSYGYYKGELDKIEKMYPEVKLPNIKIMEALSEKRDHYFLITRKMKGDPSKLSEKYKVYVDHILYAAQKRTLKNIKKQEDPIRMKYIRLIIKHTLRSNYKLKSKMKILEKYKKKFDQINVKYLKDEESLETYKKVGKIVNKRKDFKVKNKKMISETKKQIKGMINSGEHSLEINQKISEVKESIRKILSQP
jgi:hypothetical protein